MHSIHPLRETIRNLFIAIRPFDDLEKAQIELVLKWIDSGAELFRIQKPANPPIHLVSYFLVIDLEHESVLLVDHKKAGLWLPSGGHVEKDEHPRYTVERECVEELGINAEFLLDAPLFLTVSQTVGTTAGHTDVSLWYLLKGNSSQPIDFDREEFYSVRWFNLNDIPYDRTDPHMRRFIEKFSQHLLTRSST